LTNEISLIKGKYEADESYFGARRVRGKQGRGASKKTIVFGLFKRNGKVYTEIVSDCKSATLSNIIRGRADIEVSYTQMVGVVMMVLLILVTRNIYVLITVKMSLLSIIKII